MTEPTLPSSPPHEPAPPAAPGPELPLPSVATLAKANGVALVTAIALLVLVVLPAEYAVDPTGVGEALGLTRLAAHADETLAPGAASGDIEGREDRVVIEVPPGVGLEYKFFVEAGEKMQFSWEADTGPLRYDFHGEAKIDKQDYYESYTKSTAQKARGTFTAPFAGVHGWYWKNKGDTVARVTLVTSGSYEILGLR
jgi:hypothetical protein